MCNAILNTNETPKIKAVLTQITKKHVFSLTSNGIYPCRQFYCTLVEEVLRSFTYIKVAIQLCKILYYKQKSCKYNQEYALFL